MTDMIPHPFVEWCCSTYVNDPGAVGADQTGDILPEELVLYAHHVLLRDALCDAHCQWNLGINGLNDGCCCERRRHVDHGGICSSALFGLEECDKVQTSNKHCNTVEPRFANTSDSEQFG